MRVTVQFFARLRELAGCSSWTCEIADGATVADVWQAAEQQFPAIAAMAGRVSCAVNADFGRMNAVVHDGDEVAFLPPGSGGSATERD